MLYIIDANNLAGKLKMLGDRNFDKTLIEIFKNFNRDSGVDMILVFDGTEKWGSRSTVSGNLEVVYSPKDEYCQSADDKIVEMIRTGFIDSDPDERGRQITVVTDDRLLKKRIIEASGETRNTVKIERSSLWAGRITRKTFDNDGNHLDPEDEKNLSDEEIKRINDDLLNVWGKK